VKPDGSLASMFAPALKSRRTSDRLFSPAASNSSRSMLLIQSFFDAIQSFFDLWTAGCKLFSRASGITRAAKTIIDNKVVSCSLFLLHGWLSVFWYSRSGIQSQDINLTMLGSIHYKVRTCSRHARQTR
jgi:hypothetical protein